MFGYAGKILQVDLTTGKINTLPLDEKMARDYLGGTGMGAALYAKINEGKDIAAIEALSPENPLIFCTGPLTSSPIPAASRFGACSRSPLTNKWGESNSGGFFANELKKAGYDALIITGAATAPVYLAINNDDIKLLPADDLWGKDTTATIDILKEKGQVMSIGVTGEKCAAVASIAVGKHNFFGRTGMGAVMGSKKLKAVVVKGSAYKFTGADSERLKELKAELVNIQKNHFFTNALSTVGSTCGVDGGKDVGDLPIKNWQIGEFPGANNITAAHLMESGWVVGTATCWGCPVACKKEIEIKEGPFQTDECAGPEYETVASFGSMLLIDDHAFILKANDICNRFAMDTMTVGSAMAVAFECFEKGYIDEKDTGGLNLAWADPVTALKLLYQIGNVEGFGAKLAQGVDKFVEGLDPAAKDCVNTVKGLPSPYHDPRLLWALGLDYATGNIGASHVLSHTMFTQLGYAGIPEITGESTSPPPSDEGKAEWVKKCQDFGAFAATSASICDFGGICFNATHVLDSVNAATGFNYNFDSLMETGERIFVLKRCLSNIWGIRKKDDALPKRLRTGVQGGPMNGVEPTIDKMLAEYYPLRGLKDNGCIREDIIARLGIQQDIAKAVNAI